MRLLVCAGGTGGGVYPALSIVQKAQDCGFVDDVKWIGGEGGMEENLVKREGIAFEAIPAAGVHGVGLRVLPGNLLQLLRGTFASGRILKNYRPDVILFTGGYVAIPVALASGRTPRLLYVPDIEPGLALKTLARFADRICLIAEESRKYFSSRADLVVTGHPVRQGLTKWDSLKARASLGLSNDLPVLLVFGGSKGARSINRAVLRELPALLEKVQVLHISGSLDWAEVEAAASELRGDLRDRYRPFPYLHEEMGAAYTAADLIVSRAGASAVGEFPLFGKPALLIPYPYAWRYQKVNADYLSRNGAAVMIPDDQLTDRLQLVILDLFDDQPRRKKMSDAMRKLARPDAARQIVDQLQELAAGREGITRGTYQ